MWKDDNLFDDDFSNDFDSEEEPKEETSKMEFNFDFGDSFDEDDDLGDEPLPNESTLAEDFISEDELLIHDDFAESDFDDEEDDEEDEELSNDFDNITISDKFKLDFDDEIEIDDFDEDYIDSEDFDIEKEFNFDLDEIDSIDEEQQVMSRRDKRLAELVAYRKSNKSLAETKDMLRESIDEFLEVYKKYARKTLKIKDNTLLEIIREQGSGVLNISVSDRYYYLISPYITTIVNKFDRFTNMTENNHNAVADFMKLALSNLTDRRLEGRLYPVNHGEVDNAHPDDYRPISSLAVNDTSYNYITSFLRSVYNFKMNILNRKNIESSEAENIYEYYLSLLMSETLDTDHMLNYIELMDKPLEEKLTFANEVDMNAKKYTCGHCDKRVNMPRRFYKFGMVPGNDSNLRLYRLIPGLNICPHCKTINTLSKKELNYIRKAGQLEPPEIDSLRKSFKEQRPNGICYTERELSANALLDAVPNCMEYSEIDNDQQLSNQVYVLNWRGEIESYRSLINFLRNQKVDLVEQGEDKPILAEIAFDKEPVDEKETISSLAKIMCSVLNIDYDECFKRALNSCIKHLADSPLSNTLAYTTTALIKFADGYKTLIDKLKDMDDVDFERNVISLYSSYGYTDYSKINTEPRETVIERLNKLHEDFLARIKVAKSRQAEFIYQLDKYGFELGSIPITNDSTNKYARLNFLYNPELEGVINKISNSMIIFNLAEEFFKVWFVCFKPVGKSRNTDRNSYFKKINGFSGDSDEFLWILQNSMKDIDAKYDKLLKKGENIKEYIIPDFKTIELLEDLVKLRMEIVTDEYKTFVVLNKILLDKYYISKPILREHISKLEFLADDIYDLVSKYGTSDKSRLYYYFDAIFTREEIDKDYEIYMDSMAIDNIIPREVNETFGDYMKRLKAFKPGEIECIDNSNELAYKLANYYVDIECVTSMALQMTDQSNDRLYNIIAFISIINTLRHYYTCEDIVEMLGYNKETVQFLMMDSNLADTKVTQEEIEFFKKTIDLSLYIYNDEEFNESIGNCGINAQQIKEVFKNNETDIDLYCKYYENLAEAIYEFIDS